MNMKWWFIKTIQATRFYPVVRWGWRTFDKLHFLRRRREQNFFGQFVRPNDLVFDVGACFGEKTSIFLKLGARVVAIEPATASLAELRHKFANDPRVAIIPYAASAKNGWGSLAICEQEPAITTMSKSWVTHSRFAKDFRWTRVQKIPLVTLNTLIQKYGQPAFCKIDVEGYETNVLHGLTTSLPLISFEFHRELLNKTFKSLRYLDSLGQVHFNYTAYDSMHFLLPRWLDYRSLSKHLSAQTDRYLWGDIYAKL